MEKRENPVFANRTLDLSSIQLVDSSNFYRRHTYKRPSGRAHHEFHGFLLHFKNHGTNLYMWNIAQVFREKTLNKGFRFKSKE